MINETAAMAVPDRQQWHKITLIQSSAPNQIAAKATVDKGSPWFSGHFPGEPILPGIAQLKIVLEAIQRAEKRKLKISGIGKTRFKRIIEPEDEIEIHVGPLKDNVLSYAFKIMARDELACSGILLIESLDA